MTRRPLLAAVCCYSLRVAQVGAAEPAVTALAPLTTERNAETAAKQLDTLRETRDSSGATMGMAEFGAGILTLPGASLCIDPNANCSRGDNSLAFQGWPLFRRGNFAAGAGLMMGVTSGAALPYSGSPDIPRDHFRRYLTLEGTVRYYVPLADRVEIWGGVTTGLVVINDTFQSQAGLTDDAVVGPRGATLLTEGFSVGLGVGIAYAVAKHWRIGGGLRVSNWFFPENPAKDPLGDLASLTGRVTAIDLNLTLAYRARLVF